MGQVSSVVQNVQGIDGVFFFQGFDLLGHFDLEIGGFIVIFRFEGFFEAGADAVSVFGVFRDFHAFGFDALPAFFIDFVFVVEFLHTFHEKFGLRDEAVDEFVFPAIEDAGHEGVDDGVVEHAARGDDGEFFRMRSHHLNVFPDGRRRFPEYGVAFFLGEIFEDVTFAAVFTRSFQIFGLFAGFLGEFGEEFGRGLAGFHGVFDAVQCGEEEGGDGAVGIGEGVRRAKFETGGVRVVDIADEADQNGAVTGGDVRRVAEGGHDADGGFESGFQTVECVGGGGNEGVRRFVVFQNPHDEAVADGGEEIFFHVAGGEEVHGLAVFEAGRDADVRMFAGARDADDRFRFEGNVESVFAEDFADDDAGLEFIVAGLQRIQAEFPVEFELFDDVGDVALIVDFRFHAADFFMSHFDVKAAGIEFFDGLFHRGADVSAHSLPVLFLQTLGNGEALHGFLFAGSFHPEFELGRGGEDDVLDVFEGEVFHAFHRIFGEKFLEFFADVFAGIFQNGAGIDAFPVVDEVARNAERADGAAFRVNIFVIIVHVPIHGVVGDHIDACIIQSRDIHEYDGGAIGLYGRAGEEIVVVFHENAHRNFFVRVVSGKVNPDQGNETHFRMLCQQGKDSFFSVLTRGNIIQQFVHHDGKRLLCFL